MNCRKNHLLFLLILPVLVLAACSPMIYGTVQLVDPNMQPITGESVEGTVINMMNTSVSVEEASHSVSADAEGKYESGKGAISKGTYKIEAGRLGYLTETVTVELGGMAKKQVDLTLRKIPELKRRTIERSKSDEDKIINPGEVNIQPPMM